MRAMRGKLPDDDLTMVRGHRTLEEALRWAHAQVPVLTVAEVVVQDEYTHDVVVPLSDGRCLVYDCT